MTAFFDFNKQEVEFKPSGWWNEKRKALKGNCKQEKGENMTVNK